MESAENISQDFGCRSSAFSPFNLVVDMQVEEIVNYFCMIYCTPSVEIWNSRAIESFH